ncbi:hypothetical protein BU17DRAFT_63606 [Hysterangium stoloniferum]|nr:hypothetical protein BU17DRAFT_63606 [Hysterangium stoloniferum]
MSPKFRILYATKFIALCTGQFGGDLHVNSIDCSLFPPERYFEHSKSNHPIPGPQGSTAVLLYQSEIIVPAICGRLVSLQQRSITWGIIPQYFIQSVVTPDFHHFFDLSHLTVLCTPNFALGNG